MQMMKISSLTVALVTLAVMTGKSRVSAAGPFAYDGEDPYGASGGQYGGGEYAGGEYGFGEYGGDGSYGTGGYGGYGGWHGNKRNDVQMFLDMREKLIKAATNAVGFSQLAALNYFNSEALNFPYSFPGKLSLYVRELEKVPPYYKHDYLYKKTSRSNDDDMN